jgi:hypothetical protein
VGGKRACTLVAGLQDIALKCQLLRPNFNVFLQTINIGSSRRSCSVVSRPDIWYVLTHHQSRGIQWQFAYNVRLSPGDASCNTAWAQLYCAQFYRTHSDGRNVLTVVINKVHHTQRFFFLNSALIAVERTASLLHCDRWRYPFDSVQRSRSAFVSRTQAWNFVIKFSVAVIGAMRNTIKIGVNMLRAALQRTPLLVTSIEPPLFKNS